MMILGVFLATWKCSSLEPLWKLVYAIDVSLLLGNWYGYDGDSLTCWMNETMQNKKFVVKRNPHHIFWIYWAGSLRCLVVALYCEKAAAGTAYTQMHCFSCAISRASPCRANREKWERTFVKKKKILFRTKTNGVCRHKSKEKFE